MSETINVPMAAQRGHQDGDNGDPDAAPAGAVHGAGYAIEIGRRLEGSEGDARPRPMGAVAAEEVDFSQSSANNFMRIFEEYGAQQVSLFRGRKFASAWEFALHARCGCWRCRRRSARASWRSTTRRS